MATAEVIGYIPLPADFENSAEQQKRIARVVNSRLPDAIDLRFNVDKHPRHVLLSKAPPWPTMVKFADMVPLMEACKPGTILMGQTQKEEPFYRSFTGDTPHWSCHVNTGFGKSTMFCVTGAQILHQEADAGLICIDPKQVSFTPLIGIPGVEVYNDFRNVDGMWAGIEKHHQILCDRMDALSQDPTISFPSQVLMLDELSMFASLSKKRWMEMRNEDRSLRGNMPPIWGTLAECLYAGRQFACYVIVMSQRVDDNAVGRIGLLSLFNLRAMAGFNPADWKRFIGTTPIPYSSSECGRWIYTDGQNRTWVQNIFSDIKDGIEIRNYAMANRGINADPVIAGVQWVYGLEDAAAYLELKPETFRSRRKDNPIPGEERRSNRPLWRAPDLDEWARQWDKELVA